MKLRRLLVPLVLVLAAVPATVLVAPGAAVAAACTPTISMGKPSQDVTGLIVFPASYTACDSSRVAVKFRDRDVTPVAWGGGASTVVAGSGTTSAGTCDPDGQQHRWVAYATVKTPTGGTVLAQSAKVYYTSTAVTGNCGPPDGCTPSLTMDRSYQDSSGYVIFQAHYTGCQASRVRIKFRDRDGINPTAASSAGLNPYAAASNSAGQIDAGHCVPDGLAHRYVAYATMKTPDGTTLIVQSDDVYVKSTPVSACGPWHRPDGAVNS
jgi:hypothetical protein